MCLYFFSLFRLTSFYSDDLDAEIFDEWLQWTEFEKTLYPKDASRMQAHEMLSIFKKHNLSSKINVCMLMYKLLYFLYIVYVCNDESMHTNIMYKFIQ